MNSYDSAEEIQLLTQEREYYRQLANAYELMVRGIQGHNNRQVADAWVTIEKLKANNNYPIEQNYKLKQERQEMAAQLEAIAGRLRAL